MGKGAVEHSGNAVYAHSHMRFAPMEMMENRLLGLQVALRIRGIATDGLTAHADTSMLKGAGVIGLGKKMLSG